MRDVEEVDNFIDDRIPRSFIREGCGGYSGPHLATHNISRSAALRGADCPSFLPSPYPGLGLVGSGSMSYGQYLATNFDVGPADFASEDDEDQGAVAREQEDSEAEDLDSKPSSDDQDLLGFQGGGKGADTKGGQRRNSVFGRGLYAQVLEPSSEEQDSEERERVRRKAMEDAEIDMDHFKSLIKRGHNISGTGAELADLLGVDSLADSEELPLEQPNANATQGGIAWDAARTARTKTSNLQVA